MDLSIIVPVYNTPLKKLEKCLNSILCIKGLNYEVIIIDDGSESEIGVFCKSYLKDYQQLKYIYKENGGVSSARNKGINLAEGKYIQFVDSDDTIISAVFSKNLLDIHADLIIFDMAFHSENVDTIWEAFLNLNSGFIDFSGVIKGIFSSDRLNSPCAKLFRRSILVEAEIQFNTAMRFAEDEDYVLNFLQLKPSVYYINRVAYLYWRTEETGKKRLKLYADIIVENCISIHNKEKSMLPLIQMTDGNLEKYIGMLNQKKIKSMFNLISDLMVIDKIDNEIKKKILLSISDISSKSILTFPKKLKIEYFLLRNKCWMVICIISRVREIYLKKRNTR